ncbi:hypothetical protein [Pseudobacter ginsenosidimutans]|nr:hypothetical protein [Pseudobacter ginsenosidimutans]QEC44590.1 hypothetical protein FSB84_24000 [Pseudobacter ginsenosidimutans]
MKRRTLSSPLVLLSGLLFVMFLVSCSKEGPAGAEGPAGPPGPKGEGVADGVIYSDWLDVKYKPDTIHTAGGSIDTIGYYADIEVPKLTKEMLSIADVKAYINSSDITDPVIYSLPYSSGNGLYIQMSAYEKTISLYSNGDVGTVLDNKGKKFQQYRYMIVPGNAKANSAAQVKWPEYETVKAYLKLND